MSHNFRQTLNDGKVGIAAHHAQSRFSGLSVSNGSEHIYSGRTDRFETTIENGILTLTPPAGFTGDFNVRVTGSDGTALNRQTFRMSVLAEPDAVADSSETDASNLGGLDSAALDEVFATF